jgi:hypothetical protein
LKPFLVSSGSFGGSVLDVTMAEAAAQTLADVFDVNPAVVRIRIDDLYPPENAGQLTL